MLAPLIFRAEDVAIAVIFRVDDDAVLIISIGENGQLYLGIGIDADVKDSAVASKPGIGPTTVIAHTYGCDTIDD